ncbi:MAG: hypothetical protein JO184_04460 [Gammaproteobacteria bacterium]|nr:hypothetical protein [Gammaproteobacteria bacterium]MBV8308748.1 hypothetical protein [Gammaproteobacteria bacterium]MBV8404973.1 hypothetical protein [Gammaproteobacteria bacterium]
MQFFFYDFALAFGAVLGYRALEALVLLRPAPRPIRMDTWYRPIAPPKPRRPGLQANRPCAARHQLINFW